MNKYLQPQKYINFLKNKLICFNFKINRSFVSSTTALGQEIKFYISSYKEYFWRLGASYTAEKTTMHWIEHFVKPDDIVFDVGANVGAYSLLLGKKMQRVSGGGKIYAIEPESANFFSLNKNIVLNGLSHIVFPIPLAFGDKLKIGKFYLSSNIPGSATHALNEAESEGIKFDPTHIQGIISLSIDDFVQLEGVKFPNHIKIDVDGLEKLIVENMQSVLADKRLKTIVIEVANTLDTKNVLKDTIEKNGFKEFMKESADASGKIENFIYVRK